MLRSFRKSRAFAFVSGIVLAAAAGAFAFILYTGLSGSAGGNFSSATSTLGALVVSNDGAVPALDAGQTVAVPIKVTNNDSGASHTLSSSASVTFTSTPSSCASHLSLAGYTNGSDGSILDAGATYAPGVTFRTTMNVAADATTPAACAGGSWSANFDGTTTP